MRKKNKAKISPFINLTSPEMTMETIRSARFSILRTFSSPPPVGPCPQEWLQAQHLRRQGKPGGWLVAKNQMSKEEDVYYGGLIPRKLLRKLPFSISGEWRRWSSKDLKFLSQNP